MAVERGAEPAGGPTAAIFADLASRKPKAIMGFTNGRLVADIEEYERVRPVDGRCPVTWRQGFKHDAAAVVELIEEPGGVLRTASGSLWRSKPHTSTRSSRGRPAPRSRRLSRTARHPHATPPRRGHARAGRGGTGSLGLPRAPPSPLRTTAVGHLRGRPPFSMFGVGPYSFSPSRSRLRPAQGAAVPRLGLIAGAPVMAR